MEHACFVAYLLCGRCGQAESTGVVAYREVSVYTVSRRQLPVVRVGRGPSSRFLSALFSTGLLTVYIFTLGTD